MEANMPYKSKGSVHGCHINKPNIAKNGTKSTAARPTSKKKGRNDFIQTFPVRLFDISHHQDDYDTVYKPVFNRMIEAGFMGVIIRVGWGLVIDRMFRYYWSQAKGRLERAPYWYLDYYSHKGKMPAYDWGVEQAEQCWNALKGDPGEMPLVLDCEEFSGAWRITYLNRSDYRQVMKGFIDRWHQLTGSRPMIYNSPGFFWVFEEWVKELDLWVALQPGRDEGTGDRVRAREGLEGTNPLLAVHQRRGCGR
jgi:GH25 family lysozyme M1 (1,4-beta-N-acetylmuramidase)